MSLASILDQPADSALPLNPTRIIYIHASTGKTHSEIYDFTSQLLSSYRTGIDKELLEVAKRAHDADPATRPTWILAKDKWYSNSRLTATSPANAGGQRATLHSPILRYAHSKISFPANSPHCSHDIAMRPLKVSNRGIAFVKDSMTHVWQKTPTPSDEEHRTSFGSSLSLFMAPSMGLGAKKIEIARYRTMTDRFVVGGVLVVVAHDVDVLVTVLTLAATLNQNDAFFFPFVEMRDKARAKSMSVGAAPVLVD